MFGNDFDQIFAGALEIFRGEGWMEASGPFRRLTAPGRRRMDGIVDWLTGEIRERDFPENGD
jgi:hypothetical protein